MNSQKPNERNFIPESQTKSTTYKKNQTQNKTQQGDQYSKESNWRSCNIKQEKLGTTSNQQPSQKGQQSQSDPSKAPLPQGNDSQSKAKQADHKRDWNCAIKHQLRAIEEGKRIRSAVSDLAAIYHQQERTQEALDLLEKYQQVFVEEGEEALQKYENLKNTLQTQSESNNGKEKLKKIRMDGLPLRYNSSHKGRDWVKNMFAEPKRIISIKFKFARMSQDTGKINKEENGDEEAQVETGTEQCTEREAEQLCAIIECISASAVRKTLTSYEHLETEKQPIWWVGNDLNPIRDANFKKKDKTENSEENSSNTKVTDNNSSIKPKSDTALNGQITSPYKQLTQDSYQKGPDIFLENEKISLCKSEAKRKDETLFKKAWKKDSKLNLMEKDMSKVEHIEMDWSKQVDINAWCPMDMKMTDKQAAKQSTEFGDLQNIANAFRRADGLPEVKGDGQEVDWSGEGFSQAVQAPPTPGFNKDLYYGQFYNMVTAQIHPLTTDEPDQHKKEPVFLNNKDAVTIGQSVTKKPLMEEDDVSGQVEWSTVMVNGVERGQVRSNPQNWQEVFEDIGEEQVPDAMNHAGQDADQIRQELEKGMKITANTLKRQKEKTDADCNESQRMRMWEIQQQMLQLLNLPNMLPDDVESYHNTLEQANMVYTYGLNYPNYDWSNLNQQNNLFLPNSMQCNDLSVFCNTICDVNCDINML